MATEPTQIPSQRRSMLKLAELSLTASESRTEGDRPDNELAMTYALQSIAASLLVLARSEAYR